MLWAHEFPLGLAATKKKATVPKRKSPFKKRRQGLAALAPGNSHLASWLQEVKLSEYADVYAELSGKASDAARQLAFAGLALKWLFRDAKEK
jgi:hypothetical protein